MAMLNNQRVNSASLSKSHRFFPSRAPQHLPRLPRRWISRHQAHPGEQTGGACGMGFFMEKSWEFSWIIEFMGFICVVWDLVILNRNHGKLRWET